MTAASGVGVCSMVEKLEDRQLLSAAPISMHRGGNLMVQGTRGGDTIEFAVVVDDAGAKQLQITVNGTSKAVDMAKVKRIFVNASKGNDKITFIDPNGEISYRYSQLLGGPGNDTIVGGAGKDRIYGSQGHDSLSGGGGSDWLLGAQGNDSLAGEAGKDLLRGNGGADQLDGGDDDDWIDGGDGDDVITGGAGLDTIYGGEGIDDFVGTDDPTEMMDPTPEETDSPDVVTDEPDDVLDENNDPVLA